MHNLQTLEFHGDQIEYIQDGDQRWLPLRKFCDALGIDAEGQRIKLTDLARCPWSCTALLKAQVGGQSREVFCLNLDTLFGWLFTIDSSRVDEAARDKIVRYQRECPAVLRRHFFGEPGAAATPGPERQVTRQKIVAHLAEALTWAPERYADGLIKAAGLALRGMRSHGAGGGTPVRPRQHQQKHADAFSEVVRLRAAGLCHREIAERTGVDQATVSRWLGGIPAGNGAASGEGDGGQGGAA